ncbi:MAG TPA: hypothetical protein PK781_03300 [Terrimesophilobacter sp.]|nr:hypothetical protein [Terrimesophilobacter sp.]HRP99468.1 hypothetical protein [Terrimesophilobacter sp.]
MATGVELATAWVRLVPSIEGVQGVVAKELGPAEAEAEKSGQKAGAKFSTGMKAAITLASAFVLKEIVGLGTEAIASLARIEQINAATAQAIVATGGAANVSADHVAALADSLEALTATESETVQMGANTLLTFKNIANAAGVGNDIFDQTIKTLVDMSAVQGDVAGNSILLGKALNDPVANLGALTRVGVQFSEEQRNMIGSLIESGELMGAQKLILAELNGQFGGQGAAKAATYQGQLDLMEHSFGTLTETIMSAVMPALQETVRIGTDVINFIIENEAVLTALTIGLGALVVAVIAVNVAMWAMAANPVVLMIGAIVLGVGLLIAAIILLVENWDVVVAWLTDVWGGFVDWIVGVIDGFASWWNGIWGGIGSFLTDMWDGVVTWVQDLVMDHARWLYGVITGIAVWWDDVWTGISDFFGGIWDGIVGIVKGAWNAVLGWIESGVNGAINLINGILGGINAVGGVLGIEVGLIPRVNLPRLADGGTILGSGSVLVGEEGQEILHLPRGAAVEPLDYDRDTSRFEAEKPTKIDDESLQKMSRYIAFEMAQQMRSGGTVLA